VKTLSGNRLLRRYPDRQRVVPFLTSRSCSPKTRPISILHLFPIDLTGFPCFSLHRPQSPQLPGPRTFRYTAPSLGSFCHHDLSCACTLKEISLPRFPTCGLLLFIDFIPLAARKIVSLVFLFPSDRCILLSTYDFSSKECLGSSFSFSFWTAFLLIFFCAALAPLASSSRLY